MTTAVMSLVHNSVSTALIGLVLIVLGLWLVCVGDMCGGKGLLGLEMVQGPRVKCGALGYVFDYLYWYWKRDLVSMIASPLKSLPVSASGRGAVGMLDGV